MGKHLPIRVEAVSQGGDIIPEAGSEMVCLALASY